MMDKKTDWVRYHCPPYSGECANASYDADEMKKDYA